MRRATHFAHPLPILLIAFAIALCAAAALALPPKAEAAIHLGSPNTTSLTNGLVGYWPLDGATTNWTTDKATDVSGNGNVGSLGLMSTTSSPVVGKIGQALQFDGSNNSITTVDSSSLDITSAITIAGWVITPDVDSAASNYVRIVEKSKDTTTCVNPYVVYALNFVPTPINFDLTVAFGGAVTDLRSNTVPVSNRWYHVVATYDGASKKIYVNGVLDNSLPQTGPLDTSNEGLIFGDSRLGGACASGLLNGKLDDVRIYNRALSASEVNQLYKLGAANAAHASAGSGSLSQGLVGYWPLDGATTDWSRNRFYDVSGQGNYATSSGAIATSTAPVIGKIGQALRFGLSINDRLEVNSQPVLNPAVITVSIWAKSAVASQITTLFNKRISEDLAPYNNWIIAIGGSNTYEFCIADNAGTGDFFGQYCINSGPLSTKWKHIVGTYDGAVQKLYIDGALVASRAESITIASSGLPLRIGNCCNSNIQAFNGALDDARIYNRALSASEVKQLYNLGASKVGHSDTFISNGLVGYWTFDGGSIDWRTNTVNDMSGQGNTGQLISMSTTTSPVIGKIGAALNFDGSSSYIDAGNPSSLQITGNLTIAAWIKLASQPAGGSGYQIVAKDKDIGGRAYTLDYYRDCGACLRFYLNGGTSIVSSADPIATGAWTHVVATYSTDGTLTLFKNGTQIARTTGGATSIPSATANVNIGRREYAGVQEYFSGSIDDVRIYSRALSATEVQQLYNAGR